jgi:hypothetical protein
LKKFGVAMATLGPKVDPSLHSCRLGELTLHAYV